MKKSYNLRNKPRPGHQSTTSTAPVVPYTPEMQAPRMQPENPPTMESTIADLQKTFKEFSNRVCTKLDAIHEDISAMKKKMSDLEATAEDNSARMLDLEKVKLPQMEKKLLDEIESLKEKLILSEIYQRKSNLLFYGLEKKEGEKVEDVLREAFVILGLSIEDARNVALVNAHRLPSKRNSATNAPEPIIAKFVYMAQRNRLLAAFERRPQLSSNDQPNSRISVRTDLPPALKAQRGILATKAYKFRKENNLSTKIAVIGSKVVLFTKAKDSTTAEWQRYKEWRRKSSLHESHQ